MGGPRGFWILFRDVEIVSERPLPVFLLVGVEILFAGDILDQGVTVLHGTSPSFAEVLSSPSPSEAEWISVVSRLSNDRRSISEVASAEATQERVGVRGPIHPASRRPESHSRLSKKWPVKGSFPLNAPKVSIVEWRR
jgi:hypothetical protein